MAASMETLGIGGHEYLAEKIFEKVKGLPKDLELVELTKNEYDALTPAQKADPTKLYLVPGAGKYLKFQEISAEDYEALSQEAKMDPYTVYMTPGDGTYFRVIDITQEEYDALPEGEKTNPNNLYLIPGDDVEYLTKTVADTLYAGINDIPDVSGLLSKTEAASTYLSKSDASSTYQTQSGMSSYLTSSTAANTYLSKSDASSTYQTQSGMSSYLTSSNAASTYLSKTDAASTYATVTYVNTELAKINGVEYIKKNSLPQAPDTGHEKAIYLVPATAETNDLFDEYYWVDNAWELFGTAKLDLSTYETSAHAASTYLSQSAAESTYLAKDFDTHRGYKVDFYDEDGSFLDDLITIHTSYSSLTGGNAYIRMQDKGLWAVGSQYGEVGDAKYGTDRIDITAYNYPASDPTDTTLDYELEIDSDGIEHHKYSNGVNKAFIYRWANKAIGYYEDGDLIHGINGSGDLINNDYAKGHLHRYSNNLPSWITDATDSSYLFSDIVTKLVNMEPQDMTNYYTKSEVASTFLSKSDAASGYVPLETTSNIDITNTNNNIHHVLSSYYNYDPAFHTYVNRTNSRRNSAALATSYMEFSTVDPTDNTHYDEKVRIDADDGLLIQYHEDNSGAEGDLHKIELGYDGLKLEGMLVGNTVVIGCHEQMPGQTGTLVTDKSMFEMMALIEAGYNIVLRYLIEEKTNNVVTYRQVKMLQLEEYNHVFDTTGDPSAHDTIHLAFAHQHTYNTLWYYDMYSTDGQDTNVINIGQI